MAFNLRWHAPKQISPNFAERELPSGFAGLVSSNFEVGVRPIFRVSSESNSFCVENLGRLPHHQHQDRLLQQCLRLSSEDVFNNSFVYYLVLPQYPGLFAATSSRTGALNRNFVCSSKESVGVGRRGGCGTFQTRAEGQNRGIEAEVFLAVSEQCNLATMKPVINPSSWLLDLRLKS